nr:ABC transporter substrate-binding protein [Micromonospora sp. DSM 115978]
MATSCQASGAGAAAGQSCDTPGVSPSEIKAGLIYPDTGSDGLVQALSPARGAVEARIGLANASGGVHGREIVLEWRDDEGDPDRFSLVADELLDKVGVFGLIAQTTVVGESADRLDAAGVPMAGLAAEAVWSKHRNMFTFSSLNTEGASVSTFGLYAAHVGATRALMIQGPQSPSSLVLGTKLAESLQSQDVAVVDTLEYTDGSTGVTRLAERIRASGADALVGATTAEQFVEVFA